ncbi:MAG TPA: NAD(P)H-dependent glycerol-3-phosphate dehydrogenase [Clostridia bacterium]|nr:NAD(P)H-dependent glycerol-3-phosphate dehydrogenase [Clostridia bacterium]
MEKVAVIGAGSWATALAYLLGNKGLPVKMWARSSSVVQEINEMRVNPGYLPGVALPKEVAVTGSIKDALSGAAVAIYAVPSNAFRQVLGESLKHLPREALIVNTAKGLEESTAKRLSEVFTELAGIKRAGYYNLLSGPSHAEEVGRDMPTAVAISGGEPEYMSFLQDVFMTNNFRVYANNDLIGVELAGALKNIIALGTGIADGLGFGDNTRAALMTRGLAEISRLGIIMGADPLTFAGLAGVGDLIVTCTSPHSRNRRAGIEIGKGSTLEEAVKKVKMVVEGVRTTKVAKQLSELKEVEMPITSQMHEVLFNGLPAKKAVYNLMTREKNVEVKMWPQ